jgi:hypothetical protein
VKNQTNTVSCAVGDYVIGKIRTAESHVLVFGKVDEVGSGLVVGTVEKNRHVKQLRKSFEVVNKDVILNLGPKPYGGTVLKFDTSHLYTGRKITHDFFGPIHFFYVIQTEVGKTLMKAFDKAAEILRKAGLPEPVNTVWEVNPKEAKPTKYAGYYKHSRQSAKKPHTLAIKPEAVPMTVSDYLYVILHEYAHYLHANHLRSPKVNAAWIKVFNTSIKPQTIDRELSKKILKSMVDGEDRPSDYKGQLEEQERNAFNWIIRTIKQDHAVGIKELDYLFEADQKDEIESLWPRRTLNKKELAPIVSEYATTNYKELWAETFSFHYTKRKLPAGIVTLLEKTLRKVEALEDEPETEE